jgi:hypothetical protein
VRRNIGLGVAAGFAGTTAMTAGYALEHLLRRNVDGFLDYDDSNAPAVAAAHVLHWSAPSARSEKLLGLLVHWGYGSLVGVAAVPLVRREAAPAATATYWSAIMVMAAALFPTLGGTPPPWRWRRDILATSGVQHLLYAVVVVAVLRAARPAEDRMPAENPLPAEGRGPSTVSQEG